MKLGTFKNRHIHTGKRGEGGASNTAAGILKYVKAKAKVALSEQK